VAVRSDRRSDPSSEGLLGAREVTIHRWVARVRRMWKGGMFGVLSSRRTEPVVPERDRPTMDPRLVALAGLISAIAFVIIVLPGLASDEPSHWQTVLDYGRYLHLPRLGTPGVSYEAQQGPVAYVVGGIIYRLTHALIGPAGAFYTVRVLGALEFAALILLGLRLVRQTATSRLGVTAALVYLGLNPMLLAMFSSVQNDGLCLLLGFGAPAYVLSRHRGHHRRADEAGRACEYCRGTEIPACNRGPRPSPRRRAGRPGCGCAGRPIQARDRRAMRVGNRL
jgi:hypothetical protein